MDITLDTAMTSRFIRLGFGLAFLAFAVPASAANRHVDVVNKSGKELKHFYASTPDSNSWEEDILGRDVLDDGDSFDANIDDGSGACKFDFKGVFADGGSAVRKNVDVCKISTFTFK